MTPTAKSLTLDLLSALDGAPLPVRGAIAACELFGISQNNVRVALVRLSAAGLIEAAGRGEYRLAEGAEELAREVSAWRSAGGRVQAWKGGYVAVHTGAITRSERGAAARRNRALDMLGFRELEPGLSVRPDNLTGGVDALRTRLHALGLELQATVFTAGAFDERARKLWNGRELNLGYARMKQRIDKWLSRAPKLEPDVAARESFLLGNEAIRQIVFDPLLPAPLIDPAAREAFFQATRTLDREGRNVWRRFFKFNDATAPLEGLH